MARFRFAAGARIVAGLALLLILLAAIVVVLALRGSMAALDGERRIPGLAAAVIVERDAAGVPTLIASNRADLAAALGFLHAQERFFQMDLSRRLAGGRLAELFGSAALPADRATRLHGLADVADQVLEREPARRRALLEAYARGVNAGLAELSSRPFEYWLLGAPPEPWTARDTVLVQFAMYLDLTDENADADADRGVLHDVLPADAYAFLNVEGGAWDAPVYGERMTPLPPPAERWFDTAPGSAAVARAQDEVPGSNSWAVAGSLTRSGAAMLANDMHLGLRVPNIWYRARLIERHDGKDELDATGVSLPGAPGIVVGSNGHVAWGFTNSYGDWSDRVVLRAAADPASYRVPGGSEAFGSRQELIRVKGGADETLEVATSRFGPVVTAGTQRHAIRWLAHEPAASNFALLDLLDARDVEEALAIAAGCGIPPQNIVVAGHDGSLGWTIAGRIPRRYGYDPRLPVASTTRAGWRGWLDASDYPRVIDPPAQRLWTANARVAGEDDHALIGRGSYPTGARAQQIRDRLHQRESFTEANMLDIALDDYGRFLRRWRGVMVETLSPAAVSGHPRRAELRTLIEDATLRADVDNVAYRLVREFRTRVEEGLMAAYLSPAAARGSLIPLQSLPQREVVLWQSVSKRPAHLVPAPHTSWEQFLLAAIDDVIEADPQTELAARTWGSANRVRIAHPLSRVMPAFIAKRLDMVSEALPGDAFVPRVQSRSFGASQRLVVSPGHEENGIFHMPGGQSGHPLSPFYRSGHEAWARGAATPLLPGQVAYTLYLQPDSD